MAEPKPADTHTPEHSEPTGSSAPEASPKLIAVPEGAPASSPEPPAPSPAEPERKGVSKGLFAFVLVLLLLALGGLGLQSRHAAAQADRIAALGNQVEGLEVQLSAANTQIATYDMQLTLVQDSVRDVYEKMGSLLELVSIAPGLGETEPPATR